MPSPRKGFSLHKRKGVEVGLYQAQLALRDIRYFWTAKVRDEPHDPTFRLARDRAREVLALQIRQLQLVDAMMEAQEHAVDYDLRLGRYVRLTPKRKQLRDERYEAGRIEWMEHRRRRAAEKDARAQLPRPSEEAMAAFVQQHTFRSTDVGATTSPHPDRIGHSARNGAKK